MPSVTNRLTPADIIAEARTWIGTPWHQHGNLRGIGANCAAMHLALAQMLGITVEALPAEYGQVLLAPDWHLHTKREWFREAFEHGGHVRAVPVSEMRPADILLFGFGGNPCSHAGILTAITPALTMLHIDFKRQITEESLGGWRRRLRAALRLRYLEEHSC